ncbi:DUF6318 family protein [Promicromonospora sp. NPDC023805]|uniref:DUF6318 family protein n=1 Tax=Promicromonospora sp. NPDC023805 TaxID=3154696 RepID=UPI0033F217B5
MDGAAMRIAGLALAAGLALSACTGAAPDPEVATSPTGDPTPTASASPSPSPSVPTKPERPKAMEREDAKGAAAAAEYFIELYPYVMATGDTEEFEAMSHRACGFCEQALRDTGRIQARDQGFVGGTTEVKVLDQYVRDDLTGIYPLDVEVSQDASTTLDPAGSVVASAESQTSVHRIEMGRKDDRWVVVAIAPRPES